MTLRDYGRVGQFILDRGKAAGQQVVPLWWIDQATTKQIDNGAPVGGYGNYWWLRPSGAYEAVDIFGQSISTFRDESLIVVVNSAWPAATGHELSAVREAMIAAVRAVAQGQ
jgi:CubicO group peptidase (beta-lactamase class C family)